MYSKYKSLLKHNSSPSEINKFVENVEIEELCKMVLKVLNTSEVLEMLDIILQSFSELNIRHHDKRLKLVKAVFDATRQANVSNKHIDDIVSRISNNLLIFDKVHLANLVDYFIDRIRNNDDEFMSWKDLLPLLLEKIEEKKFINYRGNEVSGQEYKLIIIRSICDIDWDIKIITSIAKMFVEINSDIKDKAISEIIMKALTSKLLNIGLNELPPLVHQMLKLGNNHNSILVFSTLSKYFAKQYSSLSDQTDSEDTCNSITAIKVSHNELQEVESTVLYYIYQSVLDNITASSEYIRCLKSIINAPEYIFDAFVMSILLLVSDLHEDQTLQILKMAFLRQIQDEENNNNSAWLRQVLSNKLQAMTIINQVIENSNKDRQLIIRGMVDFAFVLLSTERKLGTVDHLPWIYGGKILKKISKETHDAAGTILELLVDKIVRSGSNIIQYTDCLAFMCRRLTMTVLEHQVWITILLDQLLVMTGNTASQILKAILPLMRISSSIRDNLIMVLRKALYRKGTQTRQMAVLGFMQLLKNLKISTLTALSQSDSLSSSNVASSSSFFTQASLERTSQRSSSNPWHNTSLCREILAILSKCFTHEIEVRSHLYKELYYGIAKNEELAEYVIEMLLEQFFKFYEKDEEILPPICFDKCSSDQGLTVIIQEPISDLVNALQRIYIKVASKDSCKIDKLADILESLCKRMSTTDVEHMGLVEEIDLSDDSPKTQQKLLNIKIAISVYETLIAYKIASWSLNSIDISQSIISLYKGCLRLVEYLKRLGKPKKGGKGKKAKKKDDPNTTLKKVGRSVNLKLPNTVLDFDTISKSVVLLYNQSNSWATSDQTSSLRGRIEFHVYILQTCLQLLQNVKLLKDQELQNYLELNKQHFLLIGETLYKFIVLDLNSVISFHENIATLGIECFKELCDVVCTLYLSILPIFLETISGVSISQGLSYQLQKLIVSLKNVFMTSLNEEISENSDIQKVPLYLIEAIFQFIQKISFNEMKDSESFDWLFDIVKNQENLDVQIASMVLQLIFFVEEQISEYGESIQDLCTELFIVLGRIDKTEVSATRKFLIVNESNAHTIFVIINKMLSSRLYKINWLLSRLKAEYIALTNFETDNESKQKIMKSKEQALCRQFTFVLGLFEILSSVKIMPGQASEVLFKNLQKAYNFASALAKYFKNKSTSTNPAFQSVKFIPVIQGAGNALKEAITELILHIESSQSSGKSNDAYVQRNKILKEVMIIPSVVQAIDMFDKEIALLSKKTGIDLMRFVKYDVIRDFRIQNSQLMENLEKMNVSLVITQNVPQNKNDSMNEESDDQNESEDEDGSDESPVKRKRTQ